jgi:hypothetical protein
MMLDLAVGQETALWSVVALGVTVGAVYGFRRGYSNRRGVRLASFVGLSIFAVAAMFWPCVGLGIYLGGEKRIAYVGLLLTPLAIVAAFLPASLVFFVLRVLPWTRNTVLSQELVVLLSRWRHVLFVVLALVGIAAGYYDR